MENQPSFNNTSDRTSRFQHIRPARCGDTGGEPWHDALRASEERYRHLVESANDWVWEVDANMVYTYVSPKCREILGYEPEEIIGRTPFDLMPLEEASRVAAVFGPIAAQRKPFRALENVNRHKDGHLVILETNGVPVLSEKGIFLGYRGMDRDITERKRAEEALARTSGRLIEAQEKERTRIARELHDDINQRIALVANELELLRQQVSGSPLERSFKRACEQLENIGHDIQAVSHRLHSSKLDYLGLAVAARSFCHELSERHRVEIDFNQADIPCDVSKEISLCLFRVLQEALQNAVKHSGATRFKVGLRKREDEILLTVSDLGLGFDPEVAAQGLGLISMRERVSLVGGTIAIRSKPHHGTVVRARVPVVNATL